MLYGRTGEHERQLEAFETAIALAQTRTVGLQSRVSTSAGVSLRESGQPAAAVEVLQRVMPARRASGKPGTLSEALDELGAAYADLGRHTEALEAYLESLDLALSRDLWHREASVRARLGPTYLALGRTAEAEEQQRLSAELYGAHGVTAPG
jgi:tetratricopeptide (TPR) repeat protein